MTLHKFLFSLRMILKHSEQHSPLWRLTLVFFGETLKRLSGPALMVRQSEVTWICMEGELPAVLVVPLGSPSLLWGHVAPVPLVGPGHLCLLFPLWPPHGQWLHYSRCFRGFLKQQISYIFKYKCSPFLQNITQNM